MNISSTHVDAREGNLTNKYKHAISSDYSKGTHGSGEGRGVPATWLPVYTLQNGRSLTKCLTEITRGRDTRKKWQAWFFFRAHFGRCIDRSGAVSTYRKPRLSSGDEINKYKIWKRKTWQLHYSPNQALHGGISTRRLAEAWYPIIEKMSNDISISTRVSHW